MPICIPDSLPTKQVLAAENIFVMTSGRAATQDIRPLEVAVLNLMPKKIETETQLGRLLGNTPLQVNLTLLTTQSYQPKHVSTEHLIAFYKTWDEVRERKFDGLIITGAPVEQLDWLAVEYWQELQQILDWSLTHVYSSFFICWGAQAALHHFYGVEKYALPQKAFGVYPHHLVEHNQILFRGFDDEFLVPVSRHTEMRAADLRQVHGLQILAESPQTGVYLARHKERRQIFAFNHPEYDAATLAGEYERDCAAGLPIQIPYNYFPGDDTKARPLMRWRAHADLLFTNWLNYYVYQETPFDLAKIA